MKEVRLTNQDHKRMDAFLERVLDAYKAGEITRDDAVGGLAHVMAALDNGNTGEAVSWFNQKGVTFFKQP
ncbi:hypothetical protein K6V72_10425 [Ralstonia insidiosa]|jgi:hypothetical protein|uniref:hypothetical protein n=1 Tax=Ralstonia TaxID=48736 RepID=UPI000CEDFB01|nr:MULTISPECIES: hypothetical protein [Ralstonia]KAB0471089.1 hypothetical protein F7R11_00265 [Ralstonia insidiosa]MBY4909405.1 hypothetical protein [Ralstonia insidiosa]MDH6643424.1 hypothetical protein [Ralstonia sp. GP73]